MNFKKKLYEKAIENYNLIAVKDFDNNKNYTYEDLIFFYHAILKLGFKNKKIGIYIDKSADYILSVFSITLSKNSFIPLDPNLPKERLEFIIKDSNIDFILTNQKFFNESKNLDCNVIKLKIEDIKIERNYNLNHKPSFNKKELMYTIYTSGTTGTPKGVLLDFNGIDNVISQQIELFELNKSIIYLFLSINFDASLSDIYCSFLSGSTLIISDNIKENIPLFIDFLNLNKIYYVDIPPSYLKLIDPDKLKTIKSIVIGGEVPSPELVRNYSKKFKLINVYGPTEATICTSYTICNEKWEEPYIGEPLKNVFYHVLDENLNEVKFEEEGELYISGIQLAVGYTDNYNTLNRFITINNTIYYKTGDKILKTDKGLIFKGRIDRQIKHNGQLICLEEIEQSINTMEEVKNITVVYKNKKIYAYFEGNINSDLIVNHISKKIPKYMIPNHFINLKIPKTPNGKNDSKYLSNALYDQIYSIFIEILNTKKIDINNSFKDLGADSIDFISLQIELNKININIPYEYLMNNNKIIDIINFKEFKYKNKSKIVENIIPIKKPIIPFNNTNIALITGATGKLGSLILKEVINKYSKIYCIIRNKSKIKTKSDKIIYLYSDDISKDNLGLSKDEYKQLSEEVSYIYHCAGNVNNLLSFENLYNDNYISTVNILKLSFNLKLKYIYYASTLSVYVSGEHENNAIFNESKLIVDDKILFTGYSQTKWLSEYYLSNHNFYNQIKIFRFGLLIDENNLKDENTILFKLNNLILNEKTLPTDDVGLCFDYTPLNLAAKIMNDYSNTNSNDIYNVSLNFKVYYNDIIKYYNKETINKEEWFNNNQNELSMYLELINNKLNNLNLFEMTNVAKFKTSIDIKKYKYNCIISKIML